MDQGSDRADEDARPAGMPEFGWTSDGRLVRLSERAVNRKPLKLVTAEGWVKWYPATASEIEKYIASRRATKRAEPRDGFEVDIDSDELRGTT